MAAFLDTVGFEFEGSGIDRDRVIGLLSNRFNLREVANVTRDASVEHKVKYISPTVTVSSTDYLANRVLYEYGGEITLGYEIVAASGGLEFPVAEKTIRRILNVLTSAGEMISPRASTHVHVGYADSFPLLKAAFAIGLWIEPLMFKIGGMGGKFRGYINNSIYCRPLELSVAVPSELGGFYSLLDYNSVFEATSIKDFWLRYGINIQQFKMAPNRYHPARYFGFNLLAIPLHGTVEYRFFNASLNSNYVIAIVRLCQAITELSTKVSGTWVHRLENSQTSNKRKSILEHFSLPEYHGFLDELEYNFDKKDLTYNTTKEQRAIIRDIIEKSDDPMFSSKMPKTHIHQFNLSVDHTESNFHHKVSNPIESGFVDIHNEQANYHSIISGDE